MIRFDRVTKLYPGNSKPALNAVDVEIRAGEFVFLVGASGSGKSSFLRLVLKEERPSSGEIHVLGQRLGAISNRKIPYFRRSLGVVFQDFRLLPGRTVFQNVAFTLQVIGKSRGFIQEAVPDVLEMVGLGGKSERLPHELSGGEQQRVAIARAVVNKPAILLADEPTGNLDPTTSQGIMQVLELINAGGTTVVMATHDVGIVDQMKRRVIELTGGDIIRDEVEGGYTTSLDLPTVVTAGGQPLGRHFTGPVEFVNAPSYPGTQPVFVRSEAPASASVPTAAPSAPPVESWSLAEDAESEPVASPRDHRLQSGHIEIIESMFAERPTQDAGPAFDEAEAQPALAQVEVEVAPAPVHQPAAALPHQHEEVAVVPAPASVGFESNLAATPLFASTTAEHPSYLTGSQPIVPRLQAPAPEAVAEPAPSQPVQRTRPPVRRAQSHPVQSHPVQSRPEASEVAIERATAPVAAQPQPFAFRSASAAPATTEPVLAQPREAQPREAQPSSMQPSSVQTAPAPVVPEPRAAASDPHDASGPTTQPVPMTFGMAPAWPAARPLVSPTPERFPTVMPLQSLRRQTQDLSVSTDPVPTITRPPAPQGPPTTMTGSFPRLPSERAQERVPSPLNGGPTPPTAPVQVHAPAAADPHRAAFSPASPAATTAPVAVGQAAQTGSSAPGRHPLSAALAAQRNLPLPPLPAPSAKGPHGEDVPPTPDERLRRLVNDDGGAYADDALALAVRLGLRRADTHAEQISAEEVGPTA